MFYTQLQELIEIMYHWFIKVYFKIREMKKIYYTYLYVINTYSYIIIIHNNLHWQCRTHTCSARELIFLLSPRICPLSSVGSIPILPIISIPVSAGLGCVPWPLFILIGGRRYKFTPKDLAYMLISLPSFLFSWRTNTESQFTPGCSSRPRNTLNSQWAIL